MFRNGMDGMDTLDDDVDGCPLSASPFRGCRTVVLAKSCVGGVASFEDLLSNEYCTGSRSGSF
jgi:hypothetical protein